MEANAKIGKDLTITPLDESGIKFNRGSVGVTLLVFRLDGWERGEDETLHLGFKTADSNPLNEISPILLTEDYETGFYYIPLPDKVLDIEGEWLMQCQKYYGWNEEDKTLNYAKAGSMASFTVAHGLRNSKNDAATVADCAALEKEFRQLSVAFETATNKTITDISKTGTDGLKDTYTINLKDGTEYSFTVTNGEKGEQGERGESGADGVTPIVGIDDRGYWTINGDSTGVKASGMSDEEKAKLESVSANASNVAFDGAKVDLNLSLSDDGVLIISTT